MTAHETGALEALRKLMQKPGGPELMAIATDSVQSGKWDDDFLMATGLTVRKTKAAQHQLMATAMIHYNLMLGRVVQIKVRALGDPGSDEDRDFNDAALSDLSNPFHACVDPDQHMGDEDGWLEWTEPVCANSVTWPAEDTSDEQWILVEPRRVPLEIGVTKPSRTLLHLRQDRGVARLPYGTDWITVFVALGELAKF